MAHIRDQGLSPRDLVCLPAAAGGPKGLALIPFDRFFYDEWLCRAARVELVGASIGAWRMTALARPDAPAALDRLRHAYVHEQRYSSQPSPAEVSDGCRRIVRAVLTDGSLELRPGVTLSVITARGRGALAEQESRLAFGRALLGNAISRSRLATHLERVIFQAGDHSFLVEPADEFGVKVVPLSARNCEDALLASGSIPLVCSAVRDIVGAPPGRYWDGALIDYHLLLPYHRLASAKAGGQGGLVLYPHFTAAVTPAWFDKFLPWRRAPRAHEWLTNVLLIAPSPKFVATLPNGKLPDRRDFYRYGADHEARARDWERAIAECERFATGAMRWLEHPDPTLLRPL